MKMGTILHPHKYDLVLNLVSGTVLIFILRFFYGQYIPADPIVELFSIPRVDKMYIMIFVFLGASYLAGYLVTVVYHAIIRRIFDITIPTRVQYVLFGIGLDPKLKLLIGGKPLTNEQRRLFMQNAKARFPALPRAYDKITDEQCIGLFHMAEHAAKNDEAAYKHIEQTETRFAIAGRLAVSIWMALSITILLSTIYVLFVASAPMIYATAVAALQLFPEEFTILIADFAKYVNRLDNSTVSIMRLSFINGLLLLFLALPTWFLLAIFRYYQMEYDRDIFMHFAYADMAGRAKNERKVSKRE